MSIATKHAADIVPRWTFGDRVRKARQIAGMGQREFAAAIGESASSLGIWETGRIIPRNQVERARRIADVSGVSLAWLLDVEGDDDGDDAQCRRHLRILD